jgi:hypothetical protein
MAKHNPSPATLATTAALLLCGAFIISFLFGLRRADSGPAATHPAAFDEPAGQSSGRVEVLNASGRAGLARAATDRLRGAGFDVVYFGNAGAQHGDSSIVLVRGSSDAAARAAARHLGIPAISAQVDTTLFVDATVILGRDWETAAAPAVTRDGFWARLRRWLGG